jgi:N-acetyl-beta-hexosaminidase
MKSEFWLVSLLFICSLGFTRAQELPFDIRGICIGAPNPDGLKQFIRFMEDDLAANGINTLVLMVDFGYEYDSYPNLRSEDALSKQDVKKLVKCAEKNNIRLIPHINLLGHQSWASRVNNLLKEYPQFDETPSIKMPDEYKWPNDDGLYCKSYCPLHPEVHSVVFALVDELTEVFEADAFHAGMDEVFYIGMDDCIRCRGKNRAELFAGEVKVIRDHLAEKNRELWIWGDRLLDGKTTGLGMWEASENETDAAIDMIPKNVVICDWHYENAEPTAAIFAMKGFRVIACPWNRPEVMKNQLEQMQNFRQNSNDVLKNRFFGVMQTVWTGSDNFLDAYYGKDQDDRIMGNVNSFKEMIKYINQKQ